MKTKKKAQITYLSAIIFIVASVIGAGIFFKNKELLEYAHGDLYFVIATWIIAGFGMIMIGLAIVEISSVQKTSRGFLEWTKIFTPKWFHSGAISYNKIIMTPFSLLTTPIYAVSAFIDAGVEIKSGWVVLAIAFSFFIYFSVTSYFSLRFSNISQWVFTILQTLPLVIIPILAFTVAKLPNSADIITKASITPPGGLSGISRWIIIIAGIPAISFAYDAFYYVTNLQEDMREKDKKKLGLSIVVGLTIVTILYLLITIAFGLASHDGTLNSFQWLENVTGISGAAFSSALNIFIAIGILGIVNGVSMSSFRLLGSLMVNDEAPLIRKLMSFILRKKIIEGDKRQAQLFALLFNIGLTLSFFLVFGAIGIHAYNNTWDSNWDPSNPNLVRETFGGYGQAGFLFAFTDVLVNYTSLLLFGIIATSILGGLVNRKTKKVAVIKKKYFIFAGIVSVIFVYASIIYIFIANIVDMTGYNGANTEDSIIKFIILIIILFFSFLPYFYERIMNNERTKEKLQNLGSKFKFRKAKQYR